MPEDDRDRPGNAVEPGGISRNVQVIAFAIPGADREQALAAHGGGMVATGFQARGHAQEIGPPRQREVKVLLTAVL